MVQSQQLAETRPRSNFPVSRIGFARYNQLNTDEMFLWLAQNILVPTAQPRDHTPEFCLSTPCGNHTITHFRGTDTTIHNHVY